jgi:anti-sigma regulatory factor (Ser/Thr protein kinase)
MIDLTRTREDFLAELEASDPGADPCRDITDPRIASAEVQVHAGGNRRRNLFSLLKLALSERFPLVPRQELLRDVLVPLKHALGNAYRHGNRRDKAKAIFVEMVLTRKGALIAITDEGSGFDVVSTLQRFHEHQAYFMNYGCGFRNLHKASSTVSYEHDGRTVLLCYQPADNRSPGASPVDRSGQSGQEQSAFETIGRLTPVLDSEWIRTCLADEVPEFANGSARLESCRVYAAQGEGDEDRGYRYVLRVAGDENPRVLTARLHATDAAAQADFNLATQLYDAKVSKRVRVPRPLARLTREPRIVLYDFDPWMNLWEYLDYRGTVSSVRKFAERMGQVLAALHASRAVGPGMAADAVDETLDPIIAGAESTLRNLPSGSDLVNRFADCVDRHKERSASWRPAVALIHGGLGWDCIHYGVDGDFYLYRFEKCRISDPGLDLGGFVADLLCFTLARYDVEAYYIGRDEFLKQYNAESQQSMGEDHLLLYIVLALCERLTKRRTEPFVARTISALDAALPVARPVTLS